MLENGGNGRDKMVRHGELFVVNVEHGLLGFGPEYKRAKHLKWLGTKVAVLGLQRLYQSKKLVGRPKDIAHLPLLKQTMALKRRARADN